MPVDTAQPVDDIIEDSVNQWYRVSRPPVGADSPRGDDECIIVQASSLARALSIAGRAAGGGFSVAVDAAAYASREEAIAASCGAQVPQEFEARDDVVVMPDEGGR